MPGLLRAMTPAEEAVIAAARARSLSPGERGHAYAGVEAACASAGTLHFNLDLAEGALIDAQDEAAGAHIEDALTDLRRCAAHLGFAVLPLDRVPPADRADALRLIHGGAS